MQNTPQYRAVDLNGKTVHVRIPVNGSVYDGEAKFVATEHLGSLHLEVHYFQMLPDRLLATKALVPPETYAHIVKNPSGSKTEFSFKAV